MTPSEYYVEFDPAIRLKLRNSNRTGTPEKPTERPFRRVAVRLFLDPVRRYVLAYFSPVAAPILLYGPDDFSAATSDTMEQHVERARECLGDDPQATLQAMLDDEAREPYWKQTAPRRVPRTIENWRARAVIERHGMTQQVEAALSTLEGEQKAIASIAWNGSAPLSRTGQTVMFIAAALKLSKKQVDDLFVEADKITV